MRTKTQPTRRTRVRIAQDAAARIKRPSREQETLFAAYVPPPGVIPAEEGRPGGNPLGMDSSEVAIYAWAVQASMGYIGGQQFFGYPILAQMALLPEYRRMTEILAKEMTRKWIKLTSAGGKADEQKLKLLDATLKAFKVRDAFRQCVELDGFYGRGHLFIDLGDDHDGDEIKTPLVIDKRKIKKGGWKGLKVIEPVWVYPNAYNSDNPLDRYYYKPQSWFVQGRLIHSSRLVTFISREVSDLLKPAYSFGGLSLTQIAKPYVDNWIRTRGSVSDLISNFSKSVLATNMGSILQGGGSETLVNRAEVFTATRDNRDLIMVDKETEEFVDVSTPLGTLDSLQTQAQEQMAAVSGIPLVVLLGTTPSGLNASSDGEIKTFYAWVRAQQEDFFTDKVQRVLEIAQLHTFGEIDPNIGFEYVSLWDEDESTKATTTKTQADTDTAYIDAGVLHPEEVRERLANDPESPYNGLDLSGPPPEPPETDVPDVSDGSEPEEEEAPGQ